MLFAFPTGVQGNAVSPGVNELIIPNYKQTWADIRKIASAPGAARKTGNVVMGTAFGIKLQVSLPGGFDSLQAGLNLTRRARGKL